MFLLYCILGVCLFGSGLAQNPNCDYRQDVQEGKTYYVYSPEYPNYYNGGVQCRWIASAPPGYNCRLDCTEIRMPSSPSCSLDRLLISKTGDAQLNQAEKYCGVGTVTAISTNTTISVGLITAKNSTGGRFICTLTAQPSEAQPNCRCGYKKSNRIVGGTPTGVNEFPMMAGLVDVTIRQIKCGCTIISERFLITAAHCVINRSPSEFIVVVGEHDISTGTDSPSTQGLPVARIIVHPQYNAGNNDYDIATLQTTTDIKFDDRVGPACLPYKFVSTSFAGETVTALGWGTTSFGGPTSDVLLKVDLNVLSQSQCSATNPPFLSRRQICTYTPNKDSCQDDSGGPLLYTDRVTGLLFHVGIISYGKFCATTNPGIGTRVTEFINWIESATNRKYCQK